MSNIFEIEKLVELFNVASAEDELEDNKCNTSDIQCTSNENKNRNDKEIKKKQSPYDKLKPPERKEHLDPEADDFDTFVESSGISSQDWKKTPKWDISYRQSVTATDVFLGMGFKNPSTSSCENMVVTIDLPGESRQNVDLKVEKEKLILISPRFFLDIKLPQPVDPKKGNAQFDANEEKLIVTLIMDRELDLVNF
ncbi:protein PIH1D3 [Sitophilus oryzae]|uniref:Protein PIH1D3 n=1 Tax=Sitophilus oryzae TaxID=7048 RepID=A0A6J2X6M8_SITOR|nr:protein PIH1D3 [Sitophilus oryzae]